GADGENTLICSEAVQFIKKERAALSIDQRVQILQHEDAGCSLPRSHEDGADAVLVDRPPRFEALDIQARMLYRVDQRLDRVRLPIAGRSHEENAALPGDVIAAVGLTGSEELDEIFPDRLFQAAAKDQIVERCDFDRLVEF